MKSTITLLLLAITLLVISGCAAKQRYEWSDYDTKLYKHYKDPAEKEEFYSAMKDTLEDAVSDGRVPPGIFAEYGFIMYEQGNSLAAIEYYQKESDKWPESRPFMAKMINIAQKRTKKQDDKSTQGIEPTVSVDNPKQSMIIPAEVSK